MFYIILTNICGVYHIDNCVLYVIDLITLLYITLFDKYVRFYIILTSRPSMSIVHMIYSSVSMLLQTGLAISICWVGAILVKAIHSIYFNIYNIFQCIFNI